MAGDISEDGRVVGFWFTRATSGSPEQSGAYLWDNGELIDLTAPSDVVSALFDSSDALVVATESGAFSQYQPDTRSLEPVDWTLPEVAPPTGFDLAWVASANRRGEIAGTLFIGDGTNAEGARGFVSAEGIVQILNPAPGGDTSHAAWINNAGQVVGGPARQQDADGTVLFDGRAFLFDVRSSDWRDLGTLPDFAGSMAWGINSRGEAVGEAWDWGSSGQYEGRATLFDTANDRLFDLNDLIPKDSGWLLTAAYDVNDVGEVVGQGIHDGKVQAFLLQPDA